MPNLSLRGSAEFLGNVELSYCRPPRMLFLIFSSSAAKFWPGKKYVIIKIMIKI
jgi:hypothetical protein